MDKELLKKIISPIHREDFKFDENSNTLISTISNEMFNIINGIPILIPPKDVADYNNNVLEILYGEKTKELRDYLYSKLKDDYYNELSKQLHRDFDKDAIIKKFIDYSKLPINKRLEWFIKIDQNNLQQINSETIITGNSYSTPEVGKKRIDTAMEMKDSWAIHLNEYSRLVTDSNPEYILELATGFGLGTCGVIESIKNSQLITVDIDYACACNALGIARYLRREYHVFPIVANFWYLPFKNDSMDTICSHYGLDESREMNRIIEEVSRVLKKEGSFILVTRKDPTIRLKQNLEGFHFTDEEYISLAKLGGLFCGHEDLIDIMEHYNLKLDYLKEYSPDHSHCRLLYKFIKK